MRTPRVSFRPGALSEIGAASPGRYPDRDAVRDDLAKAIREAEEIAGLALETLAATLRPRRTRDKRRAWNANPVIVDYLGEAPRLGSEIRLAVYRMARVHRRLNENRLHIRLLPQHRASSNTTSGHNYGGSFSPNTFVLFPYWFRSREPHTIVHELFHEWFADFKVGPLGNRRTARGPADARQLARQHPARARRNPENFEQFCREVSHLTPRKHVPGTPGAPGKGLAKGVNKRVAPRKAIRGAVEGARRIM